jgi:NAD(P)H-flavin reductase
MFKVHESKTLVPNIHLLTLEAPDVARVIRPGQFVIVRAEEGGERIPLTCSDWDAEKGTISLVFMVIGHTTHRLSQLREGTEIPTVVGPLGNPIEIKKYGTILFLGGCYGIGSIYPAAREFKALGNRIISVIEARSAHLFFREEQLHEVSEQVFYITRDGTRGYKGHVGSQLPRILDAVWPVDMLLINGCNYLMKRGTDVTRQLNVKTLVSLNTIMIDGTGMCGVCRVTVGGQRKFACVDGPYFDGHQIDWDELAKRRQMYLREETLALTSSEPEPRPVAHARRTP